MYDPMSSQGIKANVCVCVSVVYIVHECFGERTYGQDLISPPQLSTEICRTPGQDEGDEYTLAVLAAHNVEAQAGRAFMQHNLPWLPVHTGPIVH